VGWKTSTWYPCAYLRALAQATRSVENGVGDPGHETVKSSTTRPNGVIHDVYTVTKAAQCQTPRDGACTCSGRSSKRCLACERDDLLSEEVEFYRERPWARGGNGYLFHIRISMFLHSVFVSRTLIMLPPTSG
jgi:hypothetical protein